VTVGCFITGTDTGVGKTIVAAAMIRTFAQAGIPTAGMKPVASGAVRTAEGLRNSDALELMAAASVAAPYGDVNPYCFERAISPHLAARDANLKVDLGLIVSAYARLAARSSCVIVEGAGGWLAPIAPNATMASLSMALQLPVILVVGLRLGCLNHARLTAEAIGRRKVELVGWIASAVDPHFERAEDNLAELAAILGAEPLDVLSHDPQGAARRIIARARLRAISPFNHLSF